MNAPLAFVDTETTGVHPGRRAWEVAIIRRDPDGREGTWCSFVSDVDLSKADLYGLRVGRFHERHPRFAREFDTPASIRVPEVHGPDDPRYLTEAQVADQVERMTRGAHLIGCVPNFDAEVFADMLRRHQLTPAWHHHLIDVENLAVGWLAAKLNHSNTSDGVRIELGDLIIPPWKSTDLSRVCGVEPPSDDERHTALGDARWAMRLYDAIVGTLLAPATPAAARPAEAVA